MKIKICGLAEAAKFNPLPNTLAIRIHSQKDNSYPSLTHQKSFLGVLESIFDDVDFTSAREFQTAIKKDIPAFNADIAKKLLKDFSEVYKNADYLLVHCHQGIRRSPAVAIALNDIFDLGQDSKKMIAEKPKYNRFVYGTLLTTARDEGYIEF